MSWQVTTDSRREIEAADLRAAIRDAISIHEGCKNQISTISFETTADCTWNELKNGLAGCLPEASIQRIPEYSDKLLDDPDFVWELDAHYGLMTFSTPLSPHEFFDMASEQLISIDRPPHLGTKIPYKASGQLKDLGAHSLIAVLRRY